MRIALVAVIALFACNNAKDKEIAELKTKLAAATKPPTLSAAQGNAKPSMQPDASPDGETPEAPTSEQNEWVAKIKAAQTDSKIMDELFIASGRPPTGRSLSYALLLKNPNRWVGLPWNFTGRIVEINEKRGYSVSRISMDFVGGKVMWIVSLGRNDFVQNDIVEVLGIITGTQTYESISGWNITIPSMVAVNLMPRGSLGKRKSRLMARLLLMPNGPVPAEFVDRHSQPTAPPSKPKPRDLESEYKEDPAP